MVIVARTKFLNPSSITLARNDPIIGVIRRSGSSFWYGLLMTVLSCELISLSIAKIVTAA